MAFELPQPTQEPVEQSPDVDVIGVLRQLAAAAVMAHRADLRAHETMLELAMKVSELSSKVDTLISVATNIKSTADAQPAVSIPEDDPEVEALARRIDDAIAVLQGARPVDNSGLAQGGLDPNSPL